MTTLSIQSRKHQQHVEALQSRMIRSAKGVLTSFSIYCGHTLGVYRTLSLHLAMTLASLAGPHKRYTCEWLAQQTTAGIVEVDDPSSPTYAEVLANQESASHLTPLAEPPVGVSQPRQPLLDCYRHGGERKGVEAAHRKRVFNVYRLEGDVSTERNSLWNENAWKK